MGSECLEIEKENREWGNVAGCELNGPAQSKVEMCKGTRSLNNRDQSERCNLVAVASAFMWGASLPVQEYGKEIRHELCE
jgi:hypothetical protein